MIAAQPRYFSLWQRLALATVPRMTSMILRLIGTTLKFEYVTEPGFSPPTEATPGIYCFWHRCALPTLLYFRGKLRCSILVSQSFDGELIARAIARFGFDAVRGSSSRDGAAGLKGLKRAIDGGFIAAFTADGPRGPRYRTKLGPVKLAQLSQMPVGIIYVLPEKTWVARSWDGFLIPKPFSRVAIAWVGKIPPPPADAEAGQLESVRLEIESALERARHLAEDHFDHGDTQLPH